VFYVEFIQPLPATLHVSISPGLPVSPDIVWLWPYMHAVWWFMF